jgi:hypothetical protein
MVLERPLSTSCIRINCSFDLPKTNKTSEKREIRLGANINDIKIPEQMVLPSKDRTNSPLTFLPRTLNGMFFVLRNEELN